ncbi:hypothetical protein HDU92_008006 [Lobulomyces angularis]|nr:hypothetical protein HDU92_008006 [Lobulomyces angularis]
MILLEPHHKIIEETLQDRFNSDKEENVLINVCDFDNVHYRFQTLDLKTDLVLSMNMPCFNELKKYNVSQLLKKFYGNYLLDTPIDGFDVSLRLDLSNLPNSPEERAALIKSFSLLKRNAMAAPFELAFQAQQEGRQTELMPIHYREDEAIYVQAQQDRVTVIFSTVFKEETDRVFGKVFLQEFVDARRQPNIQNAPQVLYSNREPPLELRGLRGLKDSESIGYVTFVLFPRHFQSGNQREECISKIQLFRDYLHYHLKCSKSYMNSRMRTRVDSFLKVLNRAKPETPDDKKDKKTASGKSFRKH